MTNKEKIKDKLNSLGYDLGCYNCLINNVKGKDLIKLLSILDEEATDLDIKINNRDYVIELQTVDREKDFYIITKEDYINRYGSERYEE